MSSRSALLTFHLSTWLLAAGTAQCDPQWQAGDPLPHVRGIVQATTTWDPDGAGPLAPRLVVGGYFQVGSTTGVEIATFDGSSWVPLGNPPGEAVTTLGVHNGQLVAATASVVSRVVRWSGASWQPLGSTGEFNGSLRTFGVHNGELVVAGSFTTADGVACNSLARWNGTAWSGFGTGITGSVHALAVWNGSLHVGGAFTAAGGSPVGNYAIWNGSSWVAGPAFNDTVTTLATHIGQSVADSVLFAGGEFTSFTVGGVFTTAAQRVARCPGTTNIWAAMGFGPGTTVCQRLLTVPTGPNTFDVVGAGDEPSGKVRRWNGSAWINLGTVGDTIGPTEVWTLGSYAGKYVIGLTQAHRAVRTFEVTSAAWEPLRGRGMDDSVYASCTSGSELVIAGTFRTISGVVMNGIARGSADAWQPMGSGMPGAVVWALATMPNGDVVAGGSFPVAGGVPSPCVARWNGSSWSSVGLGCNDTVRALLRRSNGDLVAGGWFTVAGGTSANYVARWNGSAWANLGLGMNGPVVALAEASNGDLVAAGHFTFAGGVACNRIARWNGTTWSALGTGLDGAGLCVAALPDGGVVVGGSFLTAGGVSSPYVARWDGSAWQAVGAQFAYRPTSEVLGLTVLPDGDLVASGAQWTYSLPPPLSVLVSSNVARLDRGGNYQGLWQSLNVNGAVVHSCATSPNADVLIGGDFHLAGGTSVGNVARLASTCPATAVVGGTGCSGDTLTAASLPWANGVFHGTGTGLAPNAIVIAVTGLSAIAPALPLSVVFAEALPGCNLHAAPDLLETLVATNGTASSTLLLPNSPPLVGLVLYHQMVPIEFGPNGIVAVTATNALQLTCGIF